MLVFHRFILAAFIFLLTSYHSTTLAVGDVNLATTLTEIDLMSDKAQALSRIESLLSSANFPVRQRVSILELQASLTFQLRNFDDAIVVSNEIITLASDNDLQHVVAKAHKMTGIFQYYKGDHPQALIAYQKALSFFQAFNDDIQQANLHNNIGLVHAAMGNTLATLDSYQLAEVIYVEKGTEQDIVDIRYNIAGLYLRLKRYSIAIEMFEKVIEKRIEFNDQAGLASVYSDIAITYRQKKEFQKALDYLLDALSYYQGVNDSYNIASSYNNLSEVYNNLGQSKTAQHHAELSINISKSKGFNSIHANSLQSLAKALFAQGEIERSLSLLDLSDEMAVKGGFQQELQGNLSLRALIYAANNQLEEALATQVKYSFLIEKISNDELSEYLALFESKKLKQQVEQLQQSKTLQQLQIDQANEHRNVIIIVILATLLMAFLVYRRMVDARLKESLEIQVTQRTEALEGLATKLQQANQIKSQFLANMSHEIRTPLTAVIGQAEAIISGDVEDDFLHKEVEIIHGNSLHLLELINNILDLSKIEANKLELEVQQQDLHLIFYDLLNMFAEQAKSKGLLFEITHTLPQPFMTEIDGLRVKQILINLCSNAIKFTAKGSVIIDVSVVENNLVFNVTDTGIGLSYSQIQQVFESFTQGDSSISRRFGGSGLGLCLSEQLAQLMQGRIEIESALNQGSTFSFHLPTSQTIDLNTLSEVKKVEYDEQQSDIKRFTGKILLADDHDDNRRLIARFLTSLGLEVIGASNGKEAIEQYLQHRPQMILLDIQMPEMDGIEAFKVLRQKGCSEPIIALTANAMAHEVEHYIELGFTGHLKKPIERGQFFTLLTEYYHNDLNYEEANAQLDKVDISDLVQQFKSNLVLEQQDIILHLKNSDYERLSDLAHRIAGAAQMFGFTLLSEKAILLEKAIKASNSGEINDFTQEVLNEIDQVLW